MASLLRSGLQHSNVGSSIGNVKKNSFFHYFLSSFQSNHSFSIFRCVDYFRVPKSCVSLTFSANGSLLASAHVDDLGIYLWNNQSLYTQVSLRSIEDDFEPKTAPLPGAAPKRTQSEDDDDDEEHLADEEDDELFSSPEQLADSLVTLSLLPDSRWKNLLSLDAIKVLEGSFFLHFKFRSSSSLCLNKNSVETNRKRRPKCRNRRRSSCRISTAPSRYKLLADRNRVF